MKTEAAVSAGRHRAGEADDGGGRINVVALRDWAMTHRAGLLALAAYVLAALWVTLRLWASPGRTVNAAAGAPDTLLFEWFMAHGAQVVTGAADPFFSNRLNAPLGVNLMANTPTLGLTVPLAPVTLLFGPLVGLLVALTGSLAGTATAWYFVLSRRVVHSRLAAFVGGAVCGFAPGMVAQATGHLNLVAQFVIPLIVARVCDLGRSGRVVRDGVVLGLLAVWQALLNEELLLFTAIGCTVLVVVWSLAHRDAVRERWRRFLAAAAVGGAVAAALLAYPLWVQFFGRQTYAALPLDPAAVSADVWSYFLFSSRSLGGRAALAAQYANNTTEENTFLGLPLLLLAATALGWLWRLTAARVAGLVGLLFAAVSLGPEIVVHGHDTGIPGPYRLVEHLPLFQMSLPTRYALGAIPAVAVLLALGIDHASVGRATAGLARWRSRRTIATALVGLALLPAAPKPLPVQAVPRVPEFFTSGEWRPYLANGGTVVSVPLISKDRSDIEPLRWSTLTGLAFAMPGGYFLGPTSDTDRTALFTSPPRPTSDLFVRVMTTGTQPAIDDNARAAARDDIRYWNAAILVLDPNQPAFEPLRATVDALVGPGHQVDDVWLWDVRSLATAPA
jgi:hypothetical protein